MFWLVHVDSRCGHMFLSLLANRLQLGLVWVSAQKKSFFWLWPMYCVYMNFGAWIVCVFVIPCALQNNIICFKVGLFVRKPFIYMCDFVLVMMVSCLYVLCWWNCEGCRVSLCVADGGLDNQNKIVWVVWTNGVGFLFPWLLPSIANHVSIVSILIVPVWARTLCMAILIWLSKFGGHWWR